MIRRFLLLLCIFAGLLLLPAAFAQSRNEGELRGSGWAETQTRGVTMGFNFRVKFKLWSLVQEPVQDLFFTWGAEWIDLVEENYAGKTRREPADKFASGPRGGIALYNVTVQVKGRMLGSPRTLFVDFDAGVPGTEGKDNFNVPGSPDWEKLFYTDDGRFISAAEAREVMMQGFIGEQASIKKAHVNLTPMQSWYDDNYSGARYNALTEAARDLSEATTRIQTLSNPVELSNLRNDLQDEAKRMMRNLTPPRAFDGLERLVNKLTAGVPPEYRVPAREKIYQDELASISRRLAENLRRGKTPPDGSAEAYESWKRAKTRELASRRTPPEVRWVEPKEGTVTPLRKIVVRGQTLRPAPAGVSLKLNDRPVSAVVNAGEFSATLPLVPGKNVIEASLPDRPNALPARLEVQSTAAPTDLVVELSWDSAGDLDLHVEQPNRTVSYHDKSPTGGGFLDVDNTAGFGPERYYLSRAEGHRVPPGRYSVRVHYYRGSASPVVATVTVIRGDQVVGRYSQALYRSGETWEVISLDL